MNIEVKENYLKEDNKDLKEVVKKTSPQFKIDEMIKAALLKNTREDQ